MDFLVQTPESAAYDREVEALGSRVFRLAESPRRPWRYLPSLRNLLLTHGPYHVVHSHVHHFSGLVLREARRAGVPVRVAHSHLDTRSLDTAAPLGRRLYYTLMRHWIRRHATVGLAASGLAAEALYGPRWRDDRRWHVLFCGVDLAAFSKPRERGDARARLGLPPDVFVVGHVGRFDRQKNHGFLMDIAGALFAADPGVRLLLIGDGGLRPAIERKARAMGIADRVLTTGVRGDVPDLMTSAMDCFVFPSLYEGLGLAVVEAQAAGLPCIVADTVPREADVIPGLVTRLSLSEPASRWARAILAARNRGLPPADAINLIRASPFSIEASTRHLLEIYSL